MTARGSGVLSAVRRIARPAADTPSGRSGLLRRGLGTAGAAVLVSAALIAQSGVVTDATWNDAEWVHTDPSSDALGTVDCTDALGAFATRGEGRVLSGAALGADLDTLVEASGVETTNDGSRSQRTPGGAPQVGPDAYANPLDVTALSSINVSLTGVLELPTNTPAGAVNQYGQALSTGTSVGASGAVSDDGGISFDQFAGGVPNLATVTLSDLLNSPGIGLGDLVQNVSDFELSVGAVAGRAWLDGCRDTWGHADAVTRDYLTSHLGATLTSPTVTNLHDATFDLVNGLQGQINALLASEGVVNSLTDGLLGAVQGLLGSANLLRITQSGDPAAVTITAEIDTSELQAFIAAPISDDHGILSINLANDTVSIDLAALIGLAFHEDPGLGLNSLPPNTDPLSDPRVIAALSTALTQALGDWLSDLEGLLDAAVDAVTIHINANVYLQANLLLGWAQIGGVNATVSGTLAEVLDGDADVWVQTALLPGIPLLGTTINTLLSTLVTGLTNTLLSDVVAPVLDGVFDTLRVVPESVASAATAVSGLVSTLYNSVLIGAVRLTVNAQNDPMPGPPASGLEPHDWNDIPGGRYDVAALRIGVLNSASAEAVRLYLGRGSVGRTCTLAEAAAGGCPNY